MSIGIKEDGMITEDVKMVDVEDDLVEVDIIDAIETDEIPRVIMIVDIMEDPEVARRSETDLIQEGIITRTRRIIVMMGDQATGEKVMTEETGGIETILLADTMIEIAMNKDERISRETVRISNQELRVRLS